ncbi:FHA domain-containing protein [Kribbella sp. NPDC002412]
METEFALSLGSQRWTLPADGDTFTIGRGSNADIRLPSDDQISRIHARLNRSGGTWTLVDESRNGTALNGRRLAAPTALTNNDRIHIGRSVLTFHESTTRSTPASSAPAPTPARVPAAPTTPAGGLAAGGASVLPPTAGGTSTTPPATPRPDTSASAGGLASGDTPAPPPEPPRAAPPAQTAPAAGGTSSTPPAASRPDHASTDGLAAGNTPAPPRQPPAQAGQGGMPPYGDVPGAQPQGGVVGPSARDEAGASAQREAGGLAARGESGGLTARGEAGGPAARGEAGYSPEAAPHRAADAPGTAPSVGAAGSPRTTWSADAAGEAARDGAGSAAAGRVGASGNLAQGGSESVGEGNAAFWDDLAGEAGPRDEWEDGVQVGWVDADENASGAAWAAYPSADNPEPARSPWSEGKRPALVRPEGGPANWSESSGWPDSAFDQQQSSTPAPTPRQPEQPVRRGPVATEESAVGRVRLVRALLVGAAVLGLGLVINVVATFFADGVGGSLRWLVPPAIALIAAMVVALLDAIASEDRPRAGRLDVPVLVAIGAVLLAVGVGGFALTAGVEYAAAYVTGKESGEDRLIKPVARTGAGVTVTVENVTYTSHFTRVEVAISNGSDQPLRLPLDGQAAFTGADGNSLKADGFRSQWPDSIAAGAVEHGTITFKGHLPEGLTAATLTLRSGNPAIAVPGLALSN